MSGYKDRMFWASADEVAAHNNQEPQSKAQPSTNGEANATALYESFSYRDKDGNQVSAVVQQGKPETYHGIDI